MIERFGFKSRLMILFLVFGAVPMAIVGVIAYTASERAVLKSGVQFQHLAENIADKIDRNLFERYGDVQAFGLNRVVLNRDSWYKPSDQNDISRAMNQYVDTYDIYSLTILTDIEGRVIAVNSKDCDGKDVDTAFMLGKNYANAPWFVACAKQAYTKRMPFTAPGNDAASGTFIEDVHVDEDVRRAYPGDDGLTIGFSAPVCNADGEVIAYWSNRSKFSNVESIVRQAYADVKAEFPGTELTLLDATGNVLIDYDPATAGNEDVHHDFNVLFKLNLAQRGVAAAQAAIAGKSGTDWSMHARKKIRQGAGYAHLKGAMGYPGMNWCVLARAPEKEFRAGAGTDAITRSILMTVAISVGAIVLLGLWSAAKLSRPLNRVASALSDASREVSSAATQVNASAQQLATGASEQAASLEETSSALEEMAATTRNNAENVKRASDLSATAQHAAQAGDATMARLGEAMSGINESAGKISKIIKVIEEIAFQTNLLALNAAVEAARAGEHGKGFAVVADEVRNLAQRAANAARETTSLIEDSVHRAREGSEVATEVGEALSSIVGQATEVSKLLEGVAAASNEQAEGVGQVNTAMTQIDKATQQAAAAAEESASASEELTAQAASVLGFAEELTTFVRGRTATAGV